MLWESARVGARLGARIAEPRLGNPNTGHQVPRKLVSTDIQGRITHVVGHLGADAEHAEGDCTSTHDPQRTHRRGLAIPSPTSITFYQTH